MAGKKDAKAKASPCDRTEKNIEKRSGGTKGAPKENGQGAAREVQQRPLQEQPGADPGRGNQSPMEDIKDGWEAMREMDRVLDHLAAKGRKERLRHCWKPSQRQRAEEEYDRTKGLSRGCRQSWDLWLKGEKGSTLNINGLFHWKADDSLILHDVAKAANLEGHGSTRKVGTLYMGKVESSCAYWVPLVDWKGETVYFEARGVDYIARLPGTEDPVRWYDQFPSLAAARDTEAEEKASIETMIALDNWNWMPVSLASHITERQDKEDIDDMRFLARTQLGKRLLLLPCMEAYEVIPPERDEEEWYTENGVSRGPATTVKMLEQEEKEDAQWLER